jgi:hypothetical protein
MRINVNMYPAGGYSFKESDGSIHKSSSWTGVIKKVTRYRALNHLPPGNPTEEVHAQACSRNPALCYNEKHPTTVQKRTEASLKGRVLAWLSHRRANPGALSFSDAATAAARANICAGCPFNTPLPEGCSSCRKVVRALRQDIIGGRSQDARLHGCAVIGSDIPTAVHLEEQTLPEPALPAHCWRKRL